MTEHEVLCECDECMAEYRNTVDKYFDGDPLLPLELIKPYVETEVCLKCGEPSKLMLCNACWLLIREKRNAG